jgi:hypothetical protein
MATVTRVSVMMLLKCSRSILVLRMNVTATSSEMKSRPREKAVP